VLEPATEFLFLRNQKLESQPETKSPPAPESAMSFPPWLELNPVAALGLGSPRQAASTQLDFGSASTPTPPPMELSAVLEPPTELPSLRNQKLESRPETESSPAPESAMSSPPELEPNPMTPFEVHSEWESASQLELESRLMLG
jgi:hypothetical protein